MYKNVIINKCRNLQKKKNNSFLIEKKIKRKK